jgi:hypothetical protein
VAHISFSAVSWRRKDMGHNVHGGAEEMKRILVVMMALTILGMSKNLEKLMSSAMAKKEFEKVKTEFLLDNGEVYSDYKMEISGNELIYSYYFVKEYDREKLDVIKKALESDDSWAETIENVKDDIEQTSKIRPDTVTFIYFSFDGSEIYKITQ